MMSENRIWPVLFVLFVVVLWNRPAMTDEVKIVDARAVPRTGDVYLFSVTLSHADVGWDHYADRWEVLGPNGKVLGTRVLLHPHINEQPFTRSLRSVKIPEGIKSVTIRAHDKKHGLSKDVLEIPLPDRD